MVFEAKTIETNDNIVGQIKGIELWVDEDSVICMAKGRELSENCDQQGFKISSLIH